MSAKLALGAMALALLGCGPDGSRTRPPPTSSELSTELQGDPHPPPAPSGSDAAQPVNDDGPEISRAVGAQGGVVIMWPRIQRGAGDGDGADLAGRVQRKLYAIAQKAVPGATIDVRPDPERVCPRPKGCVAAAVGAIIRQRGNACAVVALVSGGGPSPQRIVQWAGAIKADVVTVAFREPPEPHIKVTDYVACAKIDETLAAHEDDIAAAIRAAAPR